MAETKSKLYTVNDLQEHKTEKSCWLAIHGKVYDVTEFLEEHPGGYDIVIASTGKDGTQDFEDIGHSKSARQMLDKYYIGEFEGGDATANGTHDSKGQDASKSEIKRSGPVVRFLQAFVPILLVLLAIGIKLYTSTSTTKSE